MFITPVFSQVTSISGVVNEYAAIDSIYCRNNDDVDTLKVHEIPGSLVPGSIVLVHHVKGASIDINDEGRHKDDIDKTGIYSIFRVDRAIPGPNYVILSYSFPFQDDWAFFQRNFPDPAVPGGVAQLVTIPRYEYAVVNDVLTAEAWDPQSGKGGICGMWVDRTLTLNANIDVSGKGLRGADPKDRTYTGDLSIVDTSLYNKFFYDTVPVNRAGLKGEGITRSTFSQLRGKGKSITGGGGGNGKFSGGGGGSNYAPGGDGGREIAWSPIFTGGLRGQGMYSKNFYTNTDLINRNRIFLGGGGGSGTQIPDSGFYATKGGNGGGLVIILADSIEGNNFSIIADGESVSGIATAGAGGGGGGGVIMLHANYIHTNSNLILSAVGGDGGRTRDNLLTVISDTTGPGGGGGGGAYWLFDSVASHPNMNPVINERGVAGIHIESSRNMGAGNGGFPDKITGLDIQVRGFLFNSITGDREICSDVIPPTIRGSEPHGGNKPFSYKWIRKVKDGPWEEIPGETQKSLVFTESISDTTSYRRIVLSAPPIIIDTSFVTTYYVHPAIKGNIVVANDKICAGESSGLLRTHPDSTIYSGLGPGSYSYRWRKRGPAGSWFDAGVSGYTTDPDFEETLNDTAYYKRIVKSGACLDTSNIIIIEVLQPITDNLLSQDQIICFSDNPSEISGPVPSGGDQDSLFYLWQHDPGPTNTFVTFPFDDSTNLGIYPPPLNDTTRYRRIVTSGTNRLGNPVCADTSEYVEVIVIPLIDNNLITGRDQIVCQGTDAGEITVEEVSGGDGEYSYWWEASSDQNSWRLVANSGSEHNPGLMDSTTTWFRRTVGSGGAADSVCISHSNVLQVRVIESIRGNTIATENSFDSVMCQLDPEPRIIGSSPAGGGEFITGGTYSFLWEKMKEGDSGWQVSSAPHDLKDFEGGTEIADPYDLWFRRTVFSGLDSVCIDSGAIQKIRVQSYPTWNRIDISEEICVDTELQLAGETDDLSEPGQSYYVWKLHNPFFQIIDSSVNANVVTTPLQDKISYVFTRTVYKGVCEDVSDPDTVYINPRPTAAILNSSLDEACEYDASLEAPNPDNRYYIRISFDEEEGEAPFLVKLNMDEEVLEEHELINYTDSILVDPLTEDFDTYRYSLYSVRDANGCEAKQENLAGEVELTVYATPEVEILTEEQLCPHISDPFNQSDPVIQLIADSDNGTDLVWRQLSGPVRLEIVDSTSETASVVVPGLDEFAVYRFQFRSKKGTDRVCEGIDKVELTIFEEPRLTEQGGEVDAGPLTEQYWKDMVPLSATTNAGSGTWSTTTEGIIIDNPASGDTYARNLILWKAPDYIINEFIWTVSNGVCPQVVDTLTVIRYDVKNYDGFSPNDDGINDYLIMQGLVDSEGEYRVKNIFTLYIYNTLGNLVRKVTQEDTFSPSADLDIPLKPDERIVWDGNSDNGSKVPPGIYYYGMEYYTIIFNNQQTEIGRDYGTPRRGSIVVKGY